jgi:mono/diheme cytochrome c family protein
MTRWRIVRILGAAVLLTFAGCEKGMRDMYDQPKYRPLDASTTFEDGGASRLPVPGTVPRARGTLAGTSSGRVGAQQELQRVRDLNAAENPYDVTRPLLERGRDRYEIFCAPCHSVAGDGDGYITRRGFPHPPTYHQQRLRDASDRHIFEVISNGYGVMYPYGNRIAPADRWAIVAYIRALQLSRYFPADQLPPAARAQLAEAPQ